MDFKYLDVKIEDAVAVVTITNEKTLNALNTDVIAELHKFFGKNWLTTDFRCVILTGAGKAFVAGADVGELAQLDAKGAAHKAELGQYLTKTIENFPRPVIAAINGFALGGGCEVAMACDIRLASEKAKIGQPEITLGIIPGYGGTQRLPKLVGRGKAKQLILTGDMVDAAEAHRIGLVDEVYPPEELMPKAMELAKKIAARSAPSIKLAKEVINRAVELPLSAGLELERNAFGVCFDAKDAKEGLTAFVEKRKPDFKHE